MYVRKPISIAVIVGLWAIAAAVLYIAEQTNYLLYHALAELFSIAVAGSIFLIVWNARRFIDSGYMLLVGVAYLFVAGMDLLHTLSYKGMGIFEGYGVNLASQLWISARYMEAGSLLLAFLFVRRKFNIVPAIAAYGAVFLLVMLSIFVWDIFPLCYDDAAGAQTPFKIISEYAIAGMCVVAALLLHRFRRHFSRSVLWLLTASLLITAVSEVAFTLYRDPFGPANLVGHLLKILSFYLVYRALVSTALVDPYGSLWRNLKKSEQALQRARDSLEIRVRERTTDLERTVDALQGEIAERREAEQNLENARVYAESIVKTVHEPLLVMDAELRVQSCNPAFYDLFRTSPSETEGRGLYELGAGQWDIPPLHDRLKEVVFRGTPLNDFEVHHELPGIGQRIMLLNARRIDCGEGHAPLILLAVRDITEQRRAQEAARAERHRLFSLLNVLPGYVALKSRDYRIRFANRTFIDTFGRPGDTPCYKLQFGRNTPCEDCGLPEVLARQELDDWERTYPDGQCWHVWVYPFTDTDGTELMLELGINVTERRRLEAEVVETSEMQRRRIGRDLHDSLGQNLTGLGYLFQSVAGKLSNRSDSDARVVRQIGDLINKCVAQVRALAHGLDPVGLHEDGIAAGLRELASNVESYFGVPCKLHCDGAIQVSGDLQATQIYHIAREAVNNAAKHAGASKIDVYLEDGGDEVVVRVIDDGKGIPDDARKGDGMGLRVMTHRAASIGATLTIAQRNGGGTAVTCTLPKYR
ncbi:MAG: MASE3 domain-containing protein [Phycisphaerae bacterium]